MIKRWWPWAALLIGSGSLLYGVVRGCSRSPQEWMQSVWGWLWIATLIPLYAGAAVVWERRRGKRLQPLATAIPGAIALLILVFLFTVLEPLLCA